MKPEEKAKELIEMFQYYAKEPPANSHFVTPAANHCATICVNEILNLKMINNMGRDENYSEGNFWQAVKESIQGSPAGKEMECIHPWEYLKINWGYQEIKCEKCGKEI